MLLLQLNYLNYQNICTRYKTKANSVQTHLQKSLTSPATKSTANCGEGQEIVDNLVSGQTSVIKCHLICKCIFFINFVFLFFFFCIC